MAPPATLPVHLPRHAFSARDRARAGDVWRALQEVAVEASTAAGWPPGRYREAGTAFVVRSMRVVHGRELVYGEPLTARTWVSRMRREMLSTREVELRDDTGGVVHATQEWVHVNAALEMVRASRDLLDAFPPEPLGPPAAWPASTPAEGAPFTFEFDTWYGWMDPLDHANHPAYVDWCDEAAARHLAARGIAPLALAPVAEEAEFRSAVRAPARVRVTGRAVGVTDEGAVLIAYEIHSEGVLCAKVRTLRALVGTSTSAAAAFGVER